MNARHQATSVFRSITVASIAIAITLVFVSISWCQEDKPTSDAWLSQLKAEIAADPDYNLNSALLNAARNRQALVIRWLLTQGASADVADFISGDSALHLAVVNEDLRSTIELLQKGANVASTNVNGKTPVDCARQPAIKDVLLYFRDHPPNELDPLPNRGAEKPSDAANRSTAEQTHPSTTEMPPERKVNSVAMQFRLIPAGSFMMGSKESPRALSKIFPKDQDFFEREQPYHQVQITRPFYMGIHEVTLAQFYQFVSQTKYKTSAERDPELGTTLIVHQSTFELKKGGTWLSTGFAQHPNQPVVNVSWHDAHAFCEWLSDKEGLSYRLPTEAEWEYACRAGSSTRYQTGNDPSELIKVANVSDLSIKKEFPNTVNTLPVSDGFVHTSPVGSYMPNRFDLHDMHGNVWEWCNDWYDENFYAKQINQDPTGPELGKQRSMRGGCFY